MSLRVIPAELTLSFETNGVNADAFLKEFNAITQNDEDPLGAWLKRAKARGDTKDSDQVMLTLLIELHRKFDELNERFSGTTKSRINLSANAIIDGINFTLIRVRQDAFEAGFEYYGRIDLPTFPRRTIPLFFTAIDSQTCKITRLHEDDESDWNAYVTARERVMIRQIKNKG